MYCTKEAFLKSRRKRTRAPRYSTPKLPLHAISCCHDCSEAYLGGVDQTQSLTRSCTDDGGEEPIVPICLEAGPVGQAQQLHRGVDQADAGASDLAIGASPGDAADLVRQDLDGVVGVIGIPGLEFHHHVERCAPVGVASIVQGRDERQKRFRVGLLGRLVGADADSAGELACRTGDLDLVGPVEVRDEPIPRNPRRVQRLYVGSAQDDLVAASVEEAGGQQALGLFDVPRREDDFHVDNRRVQPKRVVKVGPSHADALLHIFLLELLSGLYVEAIGGLGSGRIDGAIDLDADGGLLNGLGHDGAEFVSVILVLVAGGRVDTAPTCGRKGYRATVDDGRARYEGGIGQRRAAVVGGSHGFLRICSLRLL